MLSNLPKMAQFVSRRDKSNSSCLVLLAFQPTAPAQLEALELLRASLSKTSHQPKNSPLHLDFGSHNIQKISFKEEVSKEMNGEM